MTWDTQVAISAADLKTRLNTLSATGWTVFSIQVIDATHIVIISHKP